MATIGNPVKYQSNPYFEGVGDGTTTSYVLGWTPGTVASMIISVGGVTQPPSSYTVNGNTLTFSEAPPNGTTIVVNGLGVKAMTTLAEANVVAKDSPTGAAQIPVGSTAQRSAGVAGQIRGNTDTNSFEGYMNGSWGSLGGGATGSGTDKIFNETDTFVTQSYTIGQNAIQPCTISIGSPAVITQTNNYVAGQPVRFTTTGALPTGLDANAVYYVIATGLSTSSFRVSTTVGGSAVSTSGTQSGSQGCGKIKNAITTNITVANGATVTVPTGAVLKVM